MVNFIQNTELADSYYRIVRPFTSMIDSYEIIRSRIAQAHVGIHELYERDGRKLDKLSVRGVGKKTIRILELILAEGEERAKQIFLEEKRMEKTREEPSNFGLDHVPLYRYRPNRRARK